MTAALQQSKILTSVDSNPNFNQYFNNNNDNQEEDDQYYNTSNHYSPSISSSQKWKKKALESNKQQSNGLQSYDNFSMIHTLHQSQLKQFIDQRQVKQAIIGDVAIKGSLIQSFDSSEKRKKQRCDRRGQVIVKGGKNHKISFRDQVLPGSDVAQVKVVQNYKQYNTDMSLSANNGCGCRIL